MTGRRSWAGLILTAADRLRGWLETSHARMTATVGRDTKFTATGHVDNIAGRRDAIEIGRNCVIGGQILTFAHAGRVRIGDWVFIGEGTHIWSSSETIIGDRVLISHGVEIHDTESHPLDPTARARQARQIFSEGHPTEIDDIRAAPIRIGDDVWIGFGATIRRGVTIGDRAIVGARAVVDFDVPADGLVKGFVSSRG